MGRRGGGRGTVVDGAGTALVGGWKEVLYVWAIAEVSAAVGMSSTVLVEPI